MAHDEESFDPTNYRRYDLISKIFHHGINDATFDSVDTDEIANIADTIVSTTSELESAFNNLSQGDTVIIGRPTTSYRPTQWLDIDTDGVTVVAQSNKAEDGSELIKPADGADVGGIRVGVNSATENVHVEGIHYHGNDTTMTDSVKRLHGFIVGNNASRISFRDCFATRTHPYHEHGSGGSGFTVRKGARTVRTVDCRTEDIGDRAFQISGTDVQIARPVTRNGFDRSVALSVTQPDGNDYHGHNVTISDGSFGTNSEGSIIGVGGSAPTNDPLDNIVVSDCVAEGSFRQFVTLFPAVEGGKFVVSGCSVNQTGSPDEIPRFVHHRGSGVELVVSGCNYHGAGTSDSEGINISAAGSTTVTGSRMVNVARALSVFSTDANVEVSGCHFGGVGTGSGNAKCYIENSSKVSVSDSVIDGSTESESVEIIDSSDISLHDCEIKNAPNPNLQIRATDGNTHTNLSITDNRIIDAGGKGLVFKENSGTLNHYLATGNIIRNNPNGNLDDSASGTSKVVADNIAP